MTAEEIAAKLTPVQRDAVLSLGEFVGCRWPCTFDGPFRGVSARRLNTLRDMGLVWGRENYTTRYAGLLILGQQVRAILESNHDRA